MVQKLITNCRQLAQARATMTMEHAYIYFMILHFTTLDCPSCKKDNLNPKNYITPAIYILFKDVIGKLVNIAITFPEAQ